MYVFGYFIRTVRFEVHYVAIVSQMRIKFLLNNR